MAALIDALQAALWDKAMDGDLDACREVRAIIMARVRLLGLTDQSKRPAGWRPRTVVDEWQVADRRYLSEASMALLYKTRDTDTAAITSGP